MQLFQQSCWQHFSALSEEKQTHYSINPVPLKDSKQLLYAQSSVFPLCSCSFLHCKLKKLHLTTNCRLTDMIELIELRAPIICYCQTLHTTVYENRGIYMSKNTISYQPCIIKRISVDKFPFHFKTQICPKHTPSI